MTGLAITAQPITAADFAPFGDLLDSSGDFRLINEGACRRYHDLAQLDMAGGAAGVSIFNAQPRILPYEFTLVERHPLGSQCFMPMTQNPFLVIVAPDDGGRPGHPRAFITAPGQGVNFHRGTWHGVLTPLHAPGLFAVIDRIMGPQDTDPNLEEFHYAAGVTVTA